jgi:hypothetical protein
MKFKKEVLILIVAIAVLLLYLTLRSTNRNEIQLPQPAQLEKTAISRLVLTGKQNAPLELVKKDARWFIEPHGYPVDNVKVNNMLHSISELKLTALVSESGSYDRYGLGAGEKISVQAYRGDSALRAFSIGKPAPTFQHTFILMEGDSRVYHARGQLERTFEQSVESLRDKTIFDIDKDSITSLTLEKKGKKLDVSKIRMDRRQPLPENEQQEESQVPAPTTEWQADGGRKVDQKSVERLLEDIDHLMCDAFLEDDAGKTLKDSLWRVTFKRGEEEFSFAVYPKMDEAASQLPLTASTTPYAFLLQETRLDNIEKHLNTLLGIEAKKN